MIIYSRFSSLKSAHKILSAFIVVIFLATMVLPPGLALAQAESGLLNLPEPGTLVSTTPPFHPAVIKGLNIDPNDPLEFDFIIDAGDTGLQGEAFKAESDKLIKYFFTALTIPEHELWVNLSPYEANRIIPPALGQTEMGRDMLAQDYLLKQLSSSLIHPDESVGKKFWDKVYKKAYEQFGTTEIPVDTMNKIWIVPEKAEIYEHDKGVYIVDTHLKVMLEEDYLALESNNGHAENGLGNVKPEDLNGFTSVSAQIVREILIPEIEQEVNQGKVFANLRQMYHSMILAAWYKQALKESLMGAVYVDKEKTAGVDVEDKEVIQKIYDRYVVAMKKGVFDFIREDYDSNLQETIPRKYFSGGIKAETSQVMSRSPDSDAILRDKMGPGARAFAQDPRMVRAHAQRADEMQLARIRDTADRELRAFTAGHMLQGDSMLGRLVPFITTKIFAKAKGRVIDLPGFNAFPGRYKHDPKGNENANYLEEALQALKFSPQTFTRRPAASKIKPGRIVIELKEHWKRGEIDFKRKDIIPTRYYSLTRRDFIRVLGNLMKQNPYRFYIFLGTVMEQGGIELQNEDFMQILVKMAAGKRDRVVRQTITSRPTSEFSLALADLATPVEIIVNAGTGQEDKCLITKKGNKVILSFIQRSHTEDTEAYAHTPAHFDLPADHEVKHELGQEPVIWQKDYIERDSVGLRYKGPWQSYFSFKVKDNNLEFEMLQGISQAELHYAEAVPAEFATAWAAVKSQRAARTAHLAQVPNTGEDLDGRTARRRPGQNRRPGERHFAQDADALAKAGGKTPGGIDISSAHLKMNIASGDGNRFQMKVDPALIEEYQSATGFVHEILQVAPITNLPAFIGVQ